MVSHCVRFFKISDREDPGNNRPVSLTSIVCKLMETALKGAILNHLQQTEELSAALHGFIKQRACFSNLPVA